MFYTELNDIIKVRIIAKYCDSSEKIKNAVDSSIRVVEQGYFIDRTKVIAGRYTHTLGDVLVAIEIIDKDAEGNYSLRIRSLEELERHLSTINLIDDTPAPEVFYHVESQRAMQAEWDPNEYDYNTWEKIQKERKRLIEIEQRKQYPELYKTPEEIAREQLIKEGLIQPEAPTILNSRRISQEVMDKVWNRDGGKCVLCGSNEKIEFDHIIPFSKGGSNTYRNIQILCEACNRSKQDKIGT